MCVAFTGMHANQSFNEFRKMNGAAICVFRFCIDVLKDLLTIHFYWPLILTVLFVLSLSNLWRRKHIETSELDLQQSWTSTLFSRKASSTGLSRSLLDWNISKSDSLKSRLGHAWTVGKVSRVGLPVSSVSQNNVSQSIRNALLSSFAHGRMICRHFWPFTEMKKPFR